MAWDVMAARGAPEGFYQVRRAETVWPAPTEEEAEVVGNMAMDPEQSF